MKEKTLSQDLGLRILNRKLLSNLPMKEKKGLWFKAIFIGVRPLPAKTAKEAENHSKEGPINTTVDESRTTT